MPNLYKMIFTVLQVIAPTPSEHSHGSDDGDGRSIESNHQYLNVLSKYKSRGIFILYHQAVYSTC